MLRPARWTLMAVPLLLVSLCSASACGDPELPRFANPPPVDAGVADGGGDEDAGAER
jgi:hypothetical protein